MQTQAKLSPASRKQFHNIYLNWVTSAVRSELDMLDAAMAQSVTNEVRSMLTFVRERLVDFDLKQTLPPTLVQALEVKNWPQGESFGQVLAFHSGKPV